jgi:hypothetical protein
MTIEAIKAVKEDTTREPMRSTAALQHEALARVFAGLRLGEPLPDDAAGRETLALAFDHIVRQR